MSSLEKLNLNYPPLSKKTVPLGWYFSITAVFNKQINVKLIYFLQYSSLDILILWREKNDLQLTVKVNIVSCEWVGVVHEKCTIVRYYWIGPSTKNVFAIRQKLKTVKLQYKHFALCVILLMHLWTILLQTLLFPERTSE